MPFVNENQRRACWAKYSRDKKAGLVPKWNCKKWEEYSKKSNSKRKSHRKKSKRNSKRKSRRRKSKSTIRKR